MDLIQEIIQILQRNGFEKSTFNLRYDNENNVIGYICDESFANKSDEEVQNSIWKILKERLDEENFHRILSIFHETPNEMISRIGINESENPQRANFYLLESPEMHKYWLFIDVAKFDEDYKSCYFILNQKDNFKKAFIYNYTKEVISYMELEEDEIYNELFDNIFKIAEAEIKYHLIQKQEELNKKGHWGTNNIYYNYINKKFSLTAISKSKLLFDENEIESLNISLQNLDDAFSIKNDLKMAITLSHKINESLVAI